MTWVHYYDVAPEWDLLHMFMEIAARKWSCVWWVAILSGV